MPTEEEREKEEIAVGHACPTTLIFTNSCFTSQTRSRKALKGHAFNVVVNKYYNTEEEDFINDQSSSPIFAYRDSS